MFNGDRQTVERMRPMLQRVLICDPNQHTARFVSELMRDVSRAQVLVATSVDRGLKQAGNSDPQLIFVEYLVEGLDGLAFTRKLRRSTLSCRQVPVIMTTGEATAAKILAARDAGVHEFLRRPFSVKDLLRRLEAVMLRQRDWVEGVGYVGPDRRRFNSGDYTGPLKRGSDAPESPDQAKLQQALSILRAAVAVVERDPHQAVRAMLAQASIIGKVATASGDAEMAEAAKKLFAHIQWSQGANPLTAAKIAPYAAPLLAHLKDDASRQAA